LLSIAAGGVAVLFLVLVRTAGTYQQVVFDASKLLSGVYFSRLEPGGRHPMKKTLLLK